MIILSEDDFDEQFKPKPHHDKDEEHYETYGSDLQYVRNQPENIVWTMLDNDEGEIYIAAGYRVVNRLGYILTEQAWDDRETYVELEQFE